MSFPATRYPVPVSRLPECLSGWEGFSDEKRAGITDALIRHVFVIPAGCGRFQVEFHAGVQGFRVGLADDRESTDWSACMLAHALYVVKGGER